MHPRGWRPDDETFGARLALIRQAMGWGNVREAALACGVPPESWRNWERDGREPRNYLAICRKISDRTGVDLAWLAGLTRITTPGRVGVSHGDAAPGAHPPTRITTRVLLAPSRRAA
jgi:transcriptional regulator with XRE-family HTH domain